MTSSRIDLALAASLMLFAAPGTAQDTLIEEFDADAIFWSPAIVNFYVTTDAGTPTLTEDGEPRFPFLWGNVSEDTPVQPGAAGDEDTEPPDLSPEDQARLGVMHLSVAPPLLSLPVTPEGDWMSYDKNRRDDVHVSAIIRGKQFGKSRLWMHRAHEEDYVVKMPLGERLLVTLGVEMLREEFVINPKPADAEARRRWVNGNVRATGHIEIVEWDEMRRGGRGGRQGDTTLLYEEFDMTLSQLNQKVFAFQGNIPTVSSEAGDVLDNAVRVSVVVNLAAGHNLGFEKKPDIKTLEAELRLAFLEKDFVVDVLGRQEEGGTSEEPKE